MILTDVAVAGRLGGIFGSWCNTNDVINTFVGVVATTDGSCTEVIRSIKRAVSG